MMQNFFRNALLLLVCLSVVPCFSFDQGKGKGHGKKAGESESVEKKHGAGVEDRYENGSHHVGFPSRDREILYNYFRGGSNLPPGLAKRGGNLPPGLAKQLQRNGTLPPGLQKRFTPFPGDLEGRLSPLPSIYRRGTIGQVGVVIDRRTQRIVDVIDDVLRP